MTPVFSYFFKFIIYNTHIYIYIVPPKKSGKTLEEPKAEPVNRDYEVGDHVEYEDYWLDAVSPSFYRAI